MEITYVLDNALYVNLTNRCTCACEFCIRKNTDTVGSAHSLWLEREPTREEVWLDIQSRNPEQYRELVFCGFGEPTIRLNELLWVCKQFKAQYNLPVRVNTNGHASLIAGQDVAPLFEGLVDVVSISLNAKNAAEYSRICHPRDGEAAFDAMLDFADKVKHFVPKVIMTVVDTMPAEDIEACRKIAESLGVSFRVRSYIA